MVTGKWMWIAVISIIINIVIFAHQTNYHLRRPLEGPQKRLTATVAGPIPADQLTIDEMKFAVFGEPMNSSHDKSTGYLNYVRSHIAKPSPFRPRESSLNSRASLENSDKVDQALKGRRNGFYIECGASDGHSTSHTLFLEMERNWTGLLVEANQRFYQMLLGLNRQAHVFGGCLSPERRPRQLQFNAAGYQGGLSDQLTDTFKGHISSLKTHESSYLVQCFPLNDILAAIGVNHVDYFSLDVQGAELPILKTIDFRSIRIDVIILEVFDNDAQKKEAMRNDIRNLFRQTGLYKEPEVFSNDLLFMRLDAVA